MFLVVVLSSALHRHPLPRDTSQQILHGVSREPLTSTPYVGCLLQKATEFATKTVSVIFLKALSYCVFFSLVLPWFREEYLRT